MFDNVNVTTTQGVLAFVDVVIGAGQDNTVLRSRGELVVQAVADAATDTAVMGLGIGVITTNSRIVGGTSVPGPITDIGWDGWLYHRFVGFEANPATSASNVAILLNRVVDIDSKAMRKLPEGSSVVLIAEVSTADMVVTALGGMRWLLGH